MLDLLIDLMIEIFFNCSDYFHKCVFLNGNFSYPKGTGDYHEAVKNHICTEFSPGIAIPTMFENKTKFVVADFDYHNTGSNDYNRSEILASLNEFKKSYCVPFSIELSKRGGIHVWVFFEEPTDKADAYRTMFVLLQKAGLNNKKSFDKIIPYKEQIGLCPTIHLPFDAYFRNHGHTCFLNDDMLPITSTEEYVEFLRNIKKAKPEDVKFDDIIHLPLYMAMLL